jgi:hypothetical protein
MFCGDCGTQNPDTNQFCKNCGKPLRKNQQPSPTPTTSQPAVISVPSRQGTATASPAIPSAAQPKQKWSGIVSIFPAVISFFYFPYFFGIIAIIFGSISFYRTRKATGDIAFFAVIGIVLALVSIGIEHFYLILFPAPQLF